MGVLLQVAVQRRSGDTHDVYLNHPTAMGKFNKTATVMEVKPRRLRIGTTDGQNFAAYKATSRTTSPPEKGARAEVPHDLPPSHYNPDNAAPLAYAQATQ